MPLETLPDRFDDATHQELDRAVNKAASDALSGPLILPIQYYYLFNLIVGHSKDDLDPKYLLNSEAKSLIDNCEELQGMLSSAWERRSYREIRNLGGCLPFILIIHLSAIVVHYAKTSSDALPGSNSKKPSTSHAATVGSHYFRSSGS